MRAKPRATPDSDEHVPVKKAASMLGVSPATAYRLVESGILRAWRPAPRVINIYTASVRELKRETETDPEFWAKHTLN